MGVARTVELCRMGDRSGPIAGSRRAAEPLAQHHGRISQGGPVPGQTVVQSGIPDALSASMSAARFSSMLVSTRSGCSAVIDHHIEDYVTRARLKPAA